MKRKGIMVVLALLLSVALLLGTESLVFAGKPNRMIDVQITQAYYDSGLGEYKVHAQIQFTDIGAWGYTCRFETQTGYAYYMSGNFGGRKTSSPGLGYVTNVGFTEDPGSWVQVTCWLTRKNGALIRRFPDSDLESYPYP